MDMSSFEGMIIWGIGLFFLIAAFGCSFFVVRRFLEPEADSLTQEYFFPNLPPSKWAQLNYGKVHYIDVGSGPPLLLIHGIGASMFTWRLLIPLLSKSFRVISLDLPGFGLSEKKIELDYGLDDQTSRLAEFLDYLKLSKVDVVGSSMGGAIGLWLAYKYPQRVGRFIGLSAALNHRVLPLDLSLLGAFSKWSATQLNEAWMRRILPRVILTYENFKDEDVKAYLHPYHQQPDAIKIFIKALATIRDRRIPTQLSTMNTPILLLHGEQDKILSVKISRGALKHLPKADLKIHPRSGHHIQEDAPEWVSEKIISFCTGLPSATN